MKFCPKCGALMKKVDNEYVCPKCGYKEKINKKEDNVFIDKVNEKESILLINQRYDMFPIDYNIKCPKCGNMGAYFWSYQTRSSDEPETKFYRCVKCGYTWRVYD